MSALSEELAVPDLAVRDVTGAAGNGARPVPHRLYLVTGTDRAEVPPPARGRTGTRPAGRQQAAARPLRLTRRGQVVVGALAAIVATAGLLLAGAAAGGAQAANHGVAGGGYAGMHEIVVQPGQTLWSIATRADPSADPRLVVAEIMTANSMTSPTIDAGQLLWVPK
jgi:hypothetical protein